MVLNTYGTVNPVHVNTPGAVTGGAPGYKDIVIYIPCIVVK